MNRTRNREGEQLAQEDGSVSAQALPLDATTCQQAYETATFGMG